MSRFYLLITFLVFTQTLKAQGSGDFAPQSNPLIINAIATEGVVKVDGRLDDPDWKRAAPISDFFRMEPRQGGSYLYDTWVKVMFDKKNLYVGAFCKDSLGKKGVRVQDLRRDFDFGENDIFLMQLDPQNLKQYCVSFQTTPYGNQRDAQVFNDNNTDNNWNALWTVRTHRTDSGYYAEFAIPFKSLRYERPEVGEDVSWGVTFSRLARRDYEQTVFPAIPQSFSPYRMTYAAQLEGLELPEPSANIRVEPYLLYQYENVRQGGERDFDNNVKLGGDVKWAINPRSVLDITFNTDFAQADVDQAVNNLERFNIYFPEKRQFFLENSGIWAGANNQAVVPFFSRTVGLQGNFNAEPAKIDAGVRYTMRDEESAVAGLYIHQAETGTSPAASFAVGRYLKNYGSQNNVGVMVTHRLDESQSAPTSSASNNTTLTVDGLVRPKDQVTFSYFISGSRDNSNDTLGVAGRFYTSYNANKMYLGWVTNFVSEQYNPDMGFVFQNDVIWHSPGGYYIWRPKNVPWVRRFDPGVFFNYYHDFKNPEKVQQANIYLFPIYVYLTNGTFFEYAIYPTWQNINFNFAPLGVQIAHGNYYYTRHEINVRSDQSAKLSMTGTISWGDFYDGKRTTVKGGVRIAPIPQAALTMDYEFNDLSRLGEAKEDLKTHLTTVGSRFALNPRVQLSAFYQYNTYDEQGRWNIRASWEYLPLSFVYLVFNDTQITSLDQRYAERQFISKITFLKQF